MTKSIKSRQGLSDFGEVFISEREVKAMCNLEKDEACRIDAKNLEPACGDGNFFAELLNSFSKHLGIECRFHILCPF